MRKIIQRAPPIVPIEDEGRKLFRQEWRDDKNRLHRDGDQPAVIIYETNPSGDNVIVGEIWYKDGKKHREGMYPAEIIKGVNGNLISEFWFKEGIPVNDEQTASQINYYPNGDFKEQLSFNEKMELHSPFGPARVLNREDGRVEKSWFINGVPYRENDEPTTEIYLGNVLLYKLWEDEDSELHRSGGPASVEYIGIETIERYYNHGIPRGDVKGDPHVIRRRGGTIFREEWVDEEGEFHNEDPKLPATIDYSGNRIIKSFYSHGSFINTDKQPSQMIYIDDVLEQELWMNRRGDLNREGDKPALIKYEDDGRYEEWHTDGVLTRGDGKPAVVVFDEQDVIISQRWILNEIYYRSDDQPAIVHYYYNGKPSLEEWVSEVFADSSNTYQLSRMGDKPASVEYDEDGRVIKESWFIDGDLSRQDNPAIIEYYPSGIPKTKNWFFNNMYFRQGDLPTAENYYESGNKSSETWINSEGEYHRLEGPAFREFSEEGNVIREIFYEHDQVLEIRFPPRAAKPLDREIPICKRIFKPNPLSSEDFKNVVRELQESCFQLETEQSCNRYYKNSIYSIAADIRKQRTQVPSLTVVRGKELIYAVARKQNMFSFIDDWYINYSGERGIDDGGLRREFVTTLCDQIRPLFEYLNQGGTDPRMYISRKPDQEIIDKIGQGFKLENLLLIYEFAGALFGHAVINEYSTEIPLSRLMLSAMVSEDSGVSTQDLMTYYLLENDTDDAMDRMYQMAPTSPEYVEEFIKDTASERYLFENLSGKAHPGKVYMDAFIGGFKRVGQYLARFKILTTELFRNVCKTNITPEKFGEFISQKVTFQGEVDEDDEIVDFVIDTLSNKDDVLYDFLRSKSTDSTLSRDSILVEFYKKLLRFWSGSSVIDDSAKYYIDFNSISLAEFFPHTCALQLDINMAVVRDMDNQRFMESLFSAIQETGFTTS
jgi:antitoxin component YwqK of YwqJK toxin-antitoxin module